MKDEAAPSGARSTKPVEWLLDRGYRHVLIEIANECDGTHTTTQILKPAEFTN